MIGQVESRAVRTHSNAFEFQVFDFGTLFITKGLRKQAAFYSSLPELLLL